jgi:ABC-type nitrate/sulfonate/bicarbonate transport system substrate-binding protein
VVQAALEGSLDGIIWIREHPQEAVDYFASKFSLSPSVAKAALDQQMDAVGLTFGDEDLQGRIQRSLDATQSTRAVRIADVYDFTAFRQLVQAKHLS